ncbi:pyridoxal-dependent decarboxylase domain protein [Dictyocaulus viviparus]|uniref:Pyridoxal-dependent decarboxylase domain protein n=1 Tax=Dictyocaulus viviparus TaxID=29172 RepID=A0A0D8X6L5_DICVI|nr:pyridoxal-dependent decarboxylase domain protein [Dictyocaulus viviparus]
MVRCRSIQPLQQNNWGVTGSQLEKHIIKDLENGLIPTLFHCTLGTSATAADDDLASIYPVAQKYDMWIHCDASYSGNAWIDAKYRKNASALAHVHSVNVNLHKSLLFSHMSCLLWTKHRKTYNDAFSSHVFQMRPLQDYADVRDWGIHTSRRNKALKIWMSLRLNGLNGLRYHLNNAVEMCEYFESLVVTHPLLKIYSRKLTLLTFYYEEPGCTREERNSYTENLCQFINTSHKLYLTHTKVNDIELIRMSICYERTNKSVIDESWRILKSLVDEFTNRKNDPYLLHTKMVAPTRRRKLQKPASVDYAELSAYTRPNSSKTPDKQ